MKRSAGMRKRYPRWTGPALVILGMVHHGNAGVEIKSHDGAMLSLYDGQAVVRERYTGPVRTGTNYFDVLDFPAEADAASLTLLDRRGECTLLDWRLPARVRSSSPAAVETRRGVNIELSPAGSALPPPLEIKVGSLIHGNRTFDLAYLMTGITWQISYDVLLRGNLRDLAGTLSVDVDGWMEISNDSARAFIAAHVHVIGEDRLGKSPLPRPPGILQLDEDSPLADLWRDPPEAAAGAPNRYLISTNVSLPAFRTTMIKLVSVSRKPVIRELLIDAGEIPTDTRAAGAQPSQIIRFVNAADYGGGRAVPPGPALIHLGNQRSTLFQQAWFKHTPAQGEITIDCGKFPGINIRRITRGRTDRVDGGYEQTFELRIDNPLDQSARIVIDEQPPVTFSWSFLRANHPVNRREQRMVFAVDVDARAAKSIQYTIRVVPPGG